MKVRLPSGIEVDPSQIVKQDMEWIEEDDQHYAWMRFSVNTSDLGWVDVCDIENEDHRGNPLIEERVRKVVESSISGLLDCLMKAGEEIASLEKMSSALSRQVVQFEGMAKEYAEDKKAAIVKKTIWHFRRMKKSGIFDGSFDYRYIRTIWDEVCLNECLGPNEYLRGVFESSIKPFVECEIEKIPKRMRFLTSYCLPNFDADEEIEDHQRIGFDLIGLTSCIIDEIFREALDEGERRFSPLKQYEFD
jgi:hypothetical protein